MTSALKRAWDEVSKLPPDQQDTIAAIVFEELGAERKWDELFSSPGSQELVARMADQAIDEHRAERTRPLEELLNSIETNPPSRGRRSRSAGKRVGKKQGRR